MILSHSGIKGQKWGERHYQNKDGSLTAAGKARYAKTRMVSRTINATSAAVQNAGSVARQIEKNRYSKQNQEKIAKLSNKEMQDVITRKNLERQYVDAMADNRVSTGTDAIAAALGLAGSVAAISVAVASRGNGGKKNK